MCDSTLAIYCFTRDFLKASGGGGEQRRLQIPRKANSKRSRETYLEIYKSLTRKYIERDDWRDC